jgi:hypothetical protein
MECVEGEQNWRLGTKNLGAWPLGGAQPDQGDNGEIIAVAHVLLLLWLSAGGAAPPSRSSP